MAHLDQWLQLLNSKPCAGKVGPAYVSDAKQLANRAIQDGSKPLGMHISAIRKFLSDHPEVSTQRLTTTETNTKIIIHETNQTNRPYIDKYIGQKEESGEPLVAPATVFVSHAWMYSFADTVADAMEQHAEKEQNSYFWIDLFSNDQNAIKDKSFDWFSDTFKGSIRDIGKVLVILSPWNDPIPIRRAWCLFEISTALIVNDVELMIYLPHKEIISMSTSVQDNSDCLMQALSYIQAEKAEATSEDDKDKIFSVIKSSEGGFSSVNNHVKTKLREWYVDQLKNVVPETEDEGNLWDAVGNIFNAFGYYDEALQYIQQSLSRRLSIHGMHHPDAAHSYNSLANVYCSKGDLDKGMKYFQKSLSIRLSVLGDNHPTVATSYNNMANVYYGKGDLDKAMEYHLKSLSIDLGILGENHPAVARSYNNMANVYGDKGDLDRAMEYHQKSLSIRLSIFGDNHPEVSASYNNMATVYKDKGDFDSAMEYYQKSLTIYLSLHGEHHPDVAMVYNNIGLVYRKMSLVYQKMAMENFQKSLSINRGKFSKNQPQVVKVCRNIAQLPREGERKQNCCHQ